MDVGCYCVNVTCLLTGQEPIYVRGVAPLNEQKGVDEAFAGIMRFAELEIELFDCGFRSALRQIVEVAGERATFELPTPFLSSESPVIVRHGERTETIVCETANSCQMMVEHFAECVLNDLKPRYRPTDSLHYLQESLHQLGGHSPDSHI